MMPASASARRSFVKRSSVRAVSMLIETSFMAFPFGVAPAPEGAGVVGGLATADRVAGFQFRPTLAAFGVGEPVRVARVDRGGLVGVAVRSAVDPPSAGQGVAGKGLPRGLPLAGHAVCSMACCPVSVIIGHSVPPVKPPLQDFFAPVRFCATACASERHTVGVDHAND